MTPAGPEMSASEPADSVGSPTTGSPTTGSEGTGSQTLTLRPEAFVWLGLYEPNAQEFAEVARAFELHPLAVEDAVHAHQRPKLERYDNTFFVVLKTARYVKHAELTPTSEIVETGEIMLFVASRFVVTVRHGDIRPLTPVRADLEQHPDLLRVGPAAVLYAVTDRVVDDYLEVARRLDSDVAGTEAEIFDARRNIDVRRIYQLKREIIEFRQAAVPLAHPLALLSEDAPERLPRPLRELFRDVSDHLTLVTGQIGAYDELVGSLLQVNLAQVAVIQNSDMRKISAWAAIVAVPTLLAGIYGMNFEHMPELGWSFGSRSSWWSWHRPAWRSTVPSSATTGCDHQVSPAEDGPSARAAPPVPPRGRRAS